MSDGRTWGTVIGGIIGYFVPVIGWAAGAAIGGAVGGLLEPTKKVEQGRIDDLKVSVSQYGAGIPETWGNNVPPATWVWATDVIEIGQTQGGGKGGGGTEVTQYRQFIHGYLVLGRTPPVGSTIQIRKAWVDGKLTYDASSGLSVAQALASEENPFAQISLHPGFEDQIPHPIMEFYEGIGNTPAYRGVVGVFVFGLECPGGRIPQLSFEVVANADTEDQLLYADSLTIPVSDRVSASRLMGAPGTSTFFVEYAISASTTYQQKRVDVYSAGPDYFQRTNSFFTGPLFRGQFLAIEGDADIDALCVRRVSAQTGTDSGYNVLFDRSGEILRSIELGAECLVMGQGSSSWSKRGDYIIFGGDSTTPSAIRLYAYENLQLLGAIDVAGQTKVILTESLAWVLVGSTTLQVRSLENNLQLLASASLPIESLGDIIRFTARDGDRLALMASKSNKVNAWVWDVDYDDGSISFSLRNAIVRLAADLPYPIAGTIGVSDGMLCGWDKEDEGDDSTLRLFTLLFDRIVPNEAPIDEVIESQCERVGLSGKIDVSTIDDTVWGYTFNKSPASARNNIAPLLTYAGVAQVEEDGIIRFFHRGDKTPVATISYDELGCVEDGQEPGDPFPLTRTQEAECPRSVTVQYVNPFFDYQTSTETARRIVTDSELDETVTLDVAMTPDRAATIAHRTLYERWIARDTRSFKVSRKFAALSPGDVVTIEYPRGTTGNYMLAKVNDTGALIEGECVPADAQLLTQSVPGTNGYTGQQIAPLAAPIDLIIGDWPLLRDADDNPGIYTVMGRMGPTGSGGVLYVGDDASSMVDRGSVSMLAYAGVADSALGDWELNIRDQANVLSVSASSEAFSSSTFDALLADRSLNAIAVGAPGRWEILQFATADYLGDNTWELRDFLRGLRGTEHSKGSHQTGDKVVSLTQAAMLRPSMDIGALGVTKYYRAVPFGRRFDSAETISYANTGEGLRPFSPVDIRHEVSGSDIEITWNRRTRLTTNWLAGIVPLGESAEAYVLNIYTDGTNTSVKRRISASTSEALYTAAQMAEDGYTPGQPLYVGVQQISDTVGAGHEAYAVL